MAISRLAVIAAACSALFIAGFAGPTPSAEAKPKVKLKRIGRFKQPVYVTSAPGRSGIFVVEQRGRVRLVQGKKRRTFLNVAGLVRSGGEQGLLSIAFPPDYATSRLLYVYFTNNAGDIEIAELRANPDGVHAPTSTLRRILVVPHPRHSNHNGGQLQFGPDGLLYAGTGDGGGSGDAPDNAQNPDSMLGKLLRIDLGASTSTAATNTAAEQTATNTAAAQTATNTAAEQTTVYARGLRNPYRFSFDLITAPGQPRIAIGDVGQNRFEEIDYLGLAAGQGANFGWNDFEGFAPFEGAHPPTANPAVKPIKAYPIKGRACAVVGGYVVRDARLRGLFRRYVYGDFCAGWIRSLIPDPAGARKDRRTGLRVPSLSSFGEGTDGALYATSLDGPVFRFVRRR
ncbi:MAG TPA: PQQ-dependent sugar dehydrogenase [Solirubrobacterales bacterium]